MARKKLTKTEKVLRRVGREVKKNEPAVVRSTRRKFGGARAKKQKTAITLAKARKAGARIPKKKGR